MSLMHEQLSASLLFSDPATWLIASVVVFVAGYVRATIGFGSGLVMVGLLTLLFPIKLVVPTVLLLDVLGSILLGGYDFRVIEWRELKWLVPGSVLGLAAGAWLLSVTPAQHLTLLLGVFLLGYVVYAVRVDPSRFPTIARWWGAPLGIFGGVVGSLYGGGGPPIVAYFQMRKLDKRRFRATFQAVALADNTLRIVLYLLLGLLAAPLWGAFAVLAPAMLLGLFLGNRLHFRISERAFMNGTLGLLALIAVKYLAGSMAGLL